MADNDKPKMPEIDQLRLEVTTFLYAAVFGYGFQVLDASPWGNFLQPDTWTQATRELGSYWAGLFLYIWVFVFISIDWMFIRQVYYKEGAYGKVDFVIDILIAFFFSRMLHDAVFVLDKESHVVNFGYWWWFGLVFASYVVWDGIRIRRAYRQLGNLREAFLCQWRTVTADVVALAVIAWVYTNSWWLKQDAYFGFVVFGTLVLYWLVAGCWYLDMRAAEASNASAPPGQ